MTSEYQAAVIREYILEKKGVDIQIQEPITHGQWDLFKRAFLVAMRHKMTKNVQPEENKAP